MAIIKWEYATPSLLLLKRISNVHEKQKEEDQSHFM